MVEPSYGQKVNIIKMFFENPCYEPWSGLLELAVKPAGRAVFTFVEPSLADVVRGYARPKGVRFGGHARHRRGKRKRGWFPEDTSEIIAKRIPGKETLRNRVVSDNLKIMWAIDGVLQEGFFYWLIFDIVLTFFSQWASAIMRSEYCSQKGRGSAMYLGGLSETLQDSAKGLTPGEVIYRTGDAYVGNQGQGGSFTHHFVYSCCCTCYPEPENPANYSTQLIVLHPDGSIAGESSIKQAGAPGEKVGHIVVIHSPPFSNYTPLVISGEGKGGMMIDDCQAMVFIT